MALDRVTFAGLLEKVICWRAQVTTATHVTTMTTPLLIQPDAMTAPATWPAGGLAPVSLALPTAYELDPFQKHAVLGIHAGDHVFVTAKTGSGKTFVGEYLIARALAAGKRVFYTTPIKSLSNQKYHDLKRLFPAATVGILTGDIKMCPDAQIVVMTAEILRNLFYKRGTATEGVGLTAAVSLEGVAGIVMDEVHYIQDPDRGHVWEESLILCPRDIQLVLLSATMPSAAALAGWLADLHERRTWLLATTYRIVPLVHAVLGAENTVIPLLDERGRWIDAAYPGWLRDRKAVADAASAHKQAVAARRLDGYAGPALGAGAGKVRVEDPVARLRRTVRWLQEKGLTPALFFVFSRRDCERLAGLVEGSLLDTSDSATVAHVVDFHLSRHRAVLETSPQYHQIRGLLLRGIAFHHSGLQPLLKEIVEVLFARGFVKVLFATETFSVGLNMPTKTVLFLDLEKFSDGGVKRILRPDEYIQMAGRAGRRGIDTQGLIVYLPMHSPIDTYDLKTLLTGALPPLESRMRFHYDFVLRHHLTNGRGGQALAEQSYWAAQQRERRAALGDDIAAATVRLATLRAPLEDVLAELEAYDGLIEETRATNNARRRKAQTALDAWREERRGALWTSRLRTWSDFKEARRELARMEEAAATWDAAPLLSVTPLESCLEAWGFLERGADKMDLTELGRAATEVNEGHPILMPLLAMSDRMAEVPAADIPIVLAAFLREGGGSAADDAAAGPTLEETPMHPAALDALYWTDDTARACQSTEDRAGVLTPGEFWTLSAHWVAVVAAWQRGDTLTQIARDFGLFEGNVQRALLKVANLLEEWATVAELRRDLATLEKLRSLRFLRDDVIVDSLYLRL